MFEFVINPRSFGQTVENIFYLSFVIRNAMAKVEEDANGFPIVSWVEESEGDADAENKQTVLELTWKNWEVSTL
jgi:hypothetical protein